VPARSGGRGHRGSPAPNTPFLSTWVDTGAPGGPPPPTAGLRRDAARVTGCALRRKQSAASPAEAHQRNSPRRNPGGSASPATTTSQVRAAAASSGAFHHRAGRSFARAHRGVTRPSPQTRRVSIRIEREHAFDLLLIIPAEVRTRASAPGSGILAAQTSRAGAWDAGRIGTAHPAPSGRQLRPPAGRERERERGGQLLARPAAPAPALDFKST
jgi:hypothetical protein